MILGLDVSTRCTGYTVLSSDKLEEIGHIELHKCKDLYDKTVVAKTKFIELLDKYKIEDIAVEAPMLFFKTGSSTAKTMMILRDFQGRVKQFLFEATGIKSEEIHVSTARKIVLGSGRLSNNYYNPKVEVIKKVAELEPTLIFETRVKRNGQEVYKDYCFDEADSYVIARAYKEQYRNVAGPF